LFGFLLVFWVERVVLSQPSPVASEVDESEVVGAGEGSEVEGANHHPDVAEKGEGEQLDGDLAVGGQPGVAGGAMDMEGDGGVELLPVDGGVSGDSSGFTVVPLVDDTVREVVLSVMGVSG